MLDTDQICHTHDIFVSYSRRDELIAVAFIEMLERMGFTVWWDKELYTGQNWPDILKLKVEQARKVVVLWSPDAVASPHVKDEVIQGYKAGKLAAFMVRDCDPWKMMKLLDEIQAPRLTPTTEGFSQTDQDTIRENIALALKHALPPAAPKHVKTSLPGVVTTSSPFIGRDVELSRLLKAWRSGDDSHSMAHKTNIFTLIAMGGAGKTALLQQLRLELLRQGYAGATHVLGWSAYVQGSGENKNASAGLFIEQALTFYGADPEQRRQRKVYKTKLTEREKGKLLAQLIAKTRTLLILDGLEPLQYPPHVKKGAISDQGLAALIEGLATYNEGLLVITSRQPITDLPGGAPPETPDETINTDHESNVIHHDLEALDVAAGVGLLKNAGVVGQRAEFERLHQAAAGHALTLNLLGQYIAFFLGGDLRLMDPGQISAIGAALARIGSRKGARAIKMMDFYIERFEDLATDPNFAGGEIELALLSIIGLFDRPAEAKVIDALLADPHIKHLTDGFAELSGQERAARWRVALLRLRNLRLLLPEDPDAPGQLDAHPLVRESFGRRLQQEHEAAFKAAHLRLFDYYRWYGVPEEYRGINVHQVMALYEKKYLPDVLPAVPVDIDIEQNHYAAYTNLVIEQAEVMVRVEVEDTPIKHWRRKVPEEWLALPEVQLREQIFEFVFNAIKQQVQDLFAAVPPSVIRFLFPETLKCMAPLMDAVAHGCAAGESQSAFNHVYYPRILRGGAVDFMGAKLGEPGADLATLAHFFAKPWAQPAADLLDSPKAGLLNFVGSRLRDLGRLKDALEPYEAALKVQVKLKNWQQAALNARSVSELALTLGLLGKAVQTARKAVDYATESEDWQQRVRSLVRLAHAQTQGQNLANPDLAAVAKLFEQAETLQKRKEPNHFYLYS